MSHPFSELRELLSPTQRRVRGTVVSVIGRKARVRTRGGIGSYLVNGLSVTSGSDVYVSMGGVIAVLASPSSRPIYDV